MTTWKGWNRRRCQCAIPGCSEGGKVFPRMEDGIEHARTIHGLRFDPRSREDGLIMLDPPIAQLTKTWEGTRHSRDRAPTEEEFERLLEAARTPKEYLSLMVLGHGGMRVTEFRGIRRSWLRDGLVHIPMRDEGFKAKSKLASRAIPLRDMSGEAWDLLTGWLETHERVGVKGMAYMTIYKGMRAAGVRARLSKTISPHALRAMVGTRWAFRLGNPFILMQLMGWADIQTAMVYVRSVGRAAQDAVKTWNSNGGHEIEAHTSILRPFPTMQVT